MKSVLTKHLRASALAAAAVAIVTASPAPSQELNALIWCDHADPALLQPFEEANGVKVNVKEFEGTGAGLALVEQSQPGDWDVMVIDSIDVPRGVEKGLFEPLPEDKLPFADLFPEVKMDASTIVDGKRYAITEKFGYNTIAYNKEKVDPADMQSLASLTDPKYRSRIAIYDYYLPVIGMAALSLGKKTAELTEADLPAIKDVLLKMKANAKLVGEIVASHYSTTKAALIGFTRHLAGELGPYGITVNALAPGRIATPLVRTVSDAANQKVVDVTPLRRLGEPSEVADVCCYLTSPDAAFVTGQVVDVAGGWLMT